MRASTLTGGATVPRPQIALRLDPRSQRMLQLLEEQLNVGPSAVFRIALATLARERGIDVPPEQPEAPDDGE
jgi:hypothetical protein